jgi:hypothetical protein
MFHKGSQTSKVDVWSLFVKMLWALNIGEFRESREQFEYPEDTREAVYAASKMDIVSKIQEMVIVNPEKRASAAQLLVKCYNGGGLTTPRSQVPALTSSPSLAIAAARTPAPAPPALPTRTAQTKPKRRNANIFTAAAQFCVEKAQAQPLRRLQDLCGKPQPKS